MCAVVYFSCAHLFQRKDDLGDGVASDVASQDGERVGALAVFRLEILSNYRLHFLLLGLATE